MENAERCVTGATTKVRATSSIPIPSCQIEDLSVAVRSRSKKQTLTLPGKKAFITRFLKTGQHACSAAANALGSFKTRQGPASVIKVFMRPSKPQIPSQYAIWVKQCRSKQEAEAIITYVSIFIKSYRKKRERHTLTGHFIRYTRPIAFSAQMAHLGMGTWWRRLAFKVSISMEKKEDLDDSEHGEHSYWYQTGFWSEFLIGRWFTRPSLVVRGQRSVWTDLVQNERKATVAQPRCAATDQFLLLHC